MVILLFFVLESPTEPTPTLKNRNLKPVEQFNEGKYLALSFIRLYQLVLSGQQGDVCNFEPSCSHFSYKAIEEFGPLWGLLLSGDRLERCNPFTFHYIGKFYKVGLVQGRGYKILEKPDDVWKYK